MFDGNHRAPRRQVNLGRRRRGASTANADKSAILQRTEQLRKERHQAAAREQAARRLQRVLRGHAARRSVRNACRESLLFWSSKSSSQSNRRGVSSPLMPFERYTILLNYLLGSSCLSLDERRTLLQHYAERLGGTSPQSVPEHVWIHRITQTCLRFLQHHDHDSSSWLLALWQACQAVVPVTSTRFSGGNQGIILLAETTLQTNYSALYQILELWTAAVNCPALLAAVGWSTGRLTDDTSLQTVVRVMTATTIRVPSNDDELTAAARRLAITDVILRQALPRATLLPLVLQYWRDDPVLLALTQWLVLGRSVADLGKTDVACTNSSHDDSDSDDEDDLQVELTARTLQRQRKPRISTLSKLDRLARDAADKWRHAVVQQHTQADTTAVALATTLADPTLWVTWGRTCLKSATNNDVAVTGMASSYVTAFYQILPTGLYARTTATSPVLSRLAFDADILRDLWEHVETATTTTPSSSSLTALTVFCNVFAQTLMVIKDDEFLNRYTGQNALIAATQVIPVLRQALYHVYWVKPVQADDITAGYGGGSDPTEYTAAHFLLAGTKLYNSLYQRWCRMVRHPDCFAPEDIWWFPNLTTSARVQLGAAVQDDDSSMDSDDDDAMDISPADAESEALAAVFDDPKLSRVLTSIPQALPFDKRVKLFDSLVKADKIQTQDESREMQNAIAAMMRGQESEDGGRQRVEIRREHLYEDAMHQLNTLGTKLRQKVQVSFINQHGAAEAGIDGGGVFKEFLDDLVKDAFALEQTSTSTLPLFTVTPLETLAINLDYASRPDLLLHYEFLGRAIGKAVYEGILVDPQFCLPFLNQLLGKANSLEDLKNLDPTYYRNLTKLLSLRRDEFESLGLTFEVSIGSTGRTVELKPGGSHIAVTPENVIPYAHLLAHQLLNVQSVAQTRAFLRGFRDLVPASWVRLFAAHELQKIISGDDRGLNVASLKVTMQYAAGYHPSQPIIQWFWEIVENDLSQDQQCKLLKFMTSCSRQPLLGFKSLEPAPCVQQIRLPENLFLQDPVEILKRAPLPTSSTCMNLLKVSQTLNTAPRLI